MLSDEEIWNKLIAESHLDDAIVLFRWEFDKLLSEARSGMFTEEKLKEFAKYILGLYADSSIPVDMIDDSVLSKWLDQYKKEREHGEA